MVYGSWKDLVFKKTLFFHRTVNSVLLDFFKILLSRGYKVPETLLWDVHLNALTKNDTIHMFTSPSTVWNFLHLLLVYFTVCNNTFSLSSMGWSPKNGGNSLSDFDQKSSRTYIYQIYCYMLWKFYFRSLQMYTKIRVSDYRTLFI